MTVTITHREMFMNFATLLFDDPDIQTDECGEQLRILMEGNRDGIRTLIGDGWIYPLLGPSISNGNIEDVTELRIADDSGKVILVLVEDEIAF